MTKPKVCPQCGEPFLFAKDWGKAGALFVHSYSEESGLKAKQACHVSRAVLEGREPSEGRAENTFRPGMFGTDATPGPYAGYTRGEQWNGWATPCFTFDVARQVAEDSSRLGDGTQIFYDEERDAFIYKDTAYPDDAVIFTAQTISVRDKEMKVYAIGAYYWTWEHLDGD